MERNRNIRSIRGLGWREWHRRSGYGNRSLVEDAIYSISARWVNPPRLVLKDVSHVMSFRTRPVGAKPGL